jgi:hypothetical protein
MKTVAACVVSWLVLSILISMGLGFSWLIPVSSALTVGVLYVVAVATDARGWPLFWLLTVLHAGIGVINIQLESLVFKIAPPLEIVRGTAGGLVQVFAVSAAIAWAVTRDDPARAPLASHRLAGGLWLRLPLVALSYIVLYMSAGILILPFVRHFYMSSGLVDMPPLGVILATQFVRGLVYAVALLPLLRRMEGRRSHAALLAGLSLSVFGGIAPLLLPLDDILPAEVRAVHMLEIFCSNFLLGVIAAFLLVRRAPALRAEEVAAPA